MPFVHPLRSYSDRLNTSHCGTTLIAKICKVKGYNFVSHSTFGGHRVHILNCGVKIHLFGIIPNKINNRNLVGAGGRAQYFND